MKSLVKIFFSFRLTGLLLVFLAISIATATFIENDFGPAASRALIYQATWFELLLLLAGINLLGNMIMLRVYRRGKFSILLFHLSFLLILLGAGITRYRGFTGLMHIREGEQSSWVVSDDTYLSVQALEGDHAGKASRLLYLSALSKPGRIMNLRFGGPGTRKFSIDYLDHISNARPKLRAVLGGDPAILLVASNPEGREYHPFFREESRWIGRQNFHFNPALRMPGEQGTYTPGDMETGSSAGQEVNLGMTGDSVWFIAPYPVSLMRMGDRSREFLEAGMPHLFKPMTVYTFGSTNLVLTEKEPQAEVLAVKQEEDQGNGKTALTIRVGSGAESKTVTVWGGKGMIGEPRRITLGKVEMMVSFGSTVKSLPFSLELEDFVLERYPGSESPSSFESKVILQDQEKDVRFPYRIFMNHILNYRGYRFYQSSYDQDEKGTVLSVNRDRTGTLVTYAGYLLLAIGIFFSLINPNSRFRELNRQLARDGRGKILPVVGFLLFLLPVRAGAETRETDSARYPVPKAHAREFGKLLVQDPGGRIKPINTVSSEILRKVSRKTTLDGMGPDQVLLGMMADPLYWQHVPMIRISHPGVGEILGLEGKYASFLDFLDPEPEGGYRILAPVMKAHRKKPAERDKFDTEILRIDERENICYMVYNLDMLKILPDVHDPGHAWHSPLTVQEVYSGDDSLFAVNITRLYLETVQDGMRTGDWNRAEEYLGYLKIFQERMGSDIMPGELRQKAEILYNRLNLFDRLAEVYLATGLALLLVLLIQILGRKERLQIPRRVLLILLLAGFALHGGGLALRWYVSGHAPWSNGYEALIYISWASMLAGVLFSRKTAAPVAVTAVLSWMILHTAHLSWMDPQLTNLVPVLKSYWLTIHVAVIASSYGFLGLAALIGFLNLLLMGLHTKMNRASVASAISSLTRIMEMSMIVGLGLLTIGTFLGGVWANESWGRYWAWDPKESWALITVLVYAFIVHMRFIPGTRGIYPLNLAAVLGFSSVIMTYFGVNYYLSGLHSYAAGDPLPVPGFVYWTLGIILAVGITAGIKTRKLEVK